MNFIEFVGFLVTLLVMLYLSSRQAYRNYKEEEERPVEDDISPEIRQYLRAMRDEEEQEEEVEIKAISPPPKLKPAPRKIRGHADYTFRSSLEGRYSSSPEYFPTQSESTAVDEHYSIRSVPSRAKTMLNQIPSKKRWVVIHEVLGPPKGLS